MADEVRAAMERLLTPMLKAAARAAGLGAALEPEVAPLVGWIVDRPPAGGFADLARYIEAVGGRRPAPEPVAVRAALETLLPAQVRSVSRRAGVGPEQVLDAAPNTRLDLEDRIVDLARRTGRLEALRDALLRIGGRPEDGPPSRSARTIRLEFAVFEPTAGAHPFALTIDGGPVESRPLRLPWSPEQQANVLGLLNDLEGGAIPRSALRAWGAELGEALDRCLTAAVPAPEDRLVVAATPDAAAVHDLPWELVAFPGRRPHVLARDGGGLSRELVGEAPLPGTPAGPLLFATSEAGGSLPIAEHAALAVDAVRCPDVTAETLASGQASALHLLLHGGDVEADLWGLVGGPKGDPQRLDPDQVDVALRALAPLHFTLLLACGRTDQPRTALGRTLEAAARANAGPLVGSAFPLGKEASVVYATAFYAARGRGEPVTAGHRAGVQAVFLARGRDDVWPHEWASLQLWLGSARS